MDQLVRHYHWNYNWRPHVKPGGEWEPTPRLFFDLQSPWHGMATPPSPTHTHTPHVLWFWIQPAVYATKNKPGYWFSITFMMVRTGNLTRPCRTSAYGTASLIKEILCARATLKYVLRELISQYHFCINCCLCVRNKGTLQPQSKYQSWTMIISWQVRSLKFGKVLDFAWLYSRWPGRPDHSSALKQVVFLFKTVLSPNFEIVILWLCVYIYER